MALARARCRSKSSRYWIWKNRTSCANRNGDAPVMSSILNLPLNGGNSSVTTVLGGGGHLTSDIGLLLLRESGAPVSPDPWDRSCGCLQRRRYNAFDDGFQRHDVPILGRELLDESAAPVSGMSAALFDEDAIVEPMDYFDLLHRDSIVDSYRRRIHRMASVAEPEGSVARL